MSGRSGCIFAEPEECTSQGHSIFPRPHGHLTTPISTQMISPSYTAFKGSYSSTRAVVYLPSLKIIIQRLRATNATPSSLNSILLTTTTGQLTTPISTQTSECHHQQTHTGFKVMP